MTTPNRYVSGAVDLSALKQSPQPGNATGGAAGAAGAAGAVQTFFTVTEAGFEEQILRRSMQVPVIVLIGSDRAEASVQLKADLEELATGQRQFVVGYVDADTTPSVAQALGVQGLPTVIAVAGGRPLADFQGGQPKQNLSQWLGAITEAVAGQLEGLPAEEEAQLGAQEDPRLDAALQALNAGDVAGAIAIYDEILAEGADPKIQQARATAVVLGRRGEEQPAEFAAADDEVIAGNPEQAFQRLINVIKASAGEEKDAAKTRLIELFELFDNADPRVKDARTKLASALY